MDTTQIKINAAVDAARAADRKKAGVIGRHFASSGSSGLRSLFNELAYAVIRRVTSWRDNLEHIKNFPTSLGRNMLYSGMKLKGQDKTFFTKYYAEEPGNPWTIDFARYKTELLSGTELMPGQTATVDIAVPSALPICLTGDYVRLQKNGYNAAMVYNGEEVPLRNLIMDRFYYLPLREAGSAEIHSDHKMIVGDPIPFVQQKPHACRFALSIFIDNFGWDIIRHIDFEKTLPNMARFFSKGTIFDNCYSGANWTLPGVATLVSGRHIKNHGMFHNWQTGKSLGEDYQVMPEIFQNDDYLTFQVCNNPRKNPAYGYTKGYDRTVYAKHFSLGESFDALYDHLRAFPDRDHFCWLTIFDAHHTLAGTPHVANQTNCSLVGHDYISRHAKSPLELVEDPGKIERYVEELKRIDFSLGMLFDFIERTYDDDEFVVGVVADHGPGFLTSDPNELSHEKSHVAFMMRGHNVPKGQRVSELLHTADVLPTFLHAAGLPTASNSIDGRLPSALGGPEKRDTVVSEVIFPGSPYIAAVRDEEHELFVTSAGNVRDDGKFALGDASYSLHRLGDWQNDISSEAPDKLEKLRIVFEEHSRALRTDA